MCTTTQKQKRLKTSDSIQFQICLYCSKISNVCSPRDTYGTNEINVRKKRKRKWRKEEEKKRDFRV